MGRGAVGHVAGIKKSPEVRVDKYLMATSIRKARTARNTGNWSEEIYHSNSPACDASGTLVPTYICTYVLICTYLCLVQWFSTIHLLLLGSKCSDDPPLLTSAVASDTACPAVPAR